MTAGFMLKLMMPFWPMRAEHRARNSGNAPNWSGTNYLNDLAGIR
jgi:hypothetical protein